MCGTSYYDYSINNTVDLCNTCSYLNRDSSSQRIYYTNFTSFNILTGITKSQLNIWYNLGYVHIVNDYCFKLTPVAKLLLQNNELGMLELVSYGTWYPNCSSTLWRLKNN